MRSLRDNIKCTNIHSIWLPEGEEKEEVLDKTFEEIIPNHFLNMIKETVTQVQEVQEAPYRMNPRHKPLRHMLFKLEKIKDKEKKLNQ